MRDIERDLTRAVRSADQTFERDGGSSRHYVRDHLLRELERQGLVVRPADARGAVDALRALLVAVEDYIDRPLTDESTRCALVDAMSTARAAAGGQSETAPASDEERNDG